MLFCLIALASRIVQSLVGVVTYALCMLPTHIKTLDMGFNSGESAKYARFQASFHFGRLDLDLFKKMSKNDLGICRILPWKREGRVCVNRKLSLYII